MFSNVGFGQVAWNSELRVMGRIVLESDVHITEDGCPLIRPTCQYHLFPSRVILVRNAVAVIRAYVAFRVVRYDRGE
jgi:hypothetical protein